jgi:hypothetical protein
MKELPVLSHNRTTVDFFVGSYRLSAAVKTYKRTLIDILADQMTNYLDLEDVYVSRINNPGHIVATYETGSLVKDEINLILLSSETDSVSKDRFYAPNRARLPIFVTTPSFEVQGEFQWLKDLNTRKILATDTQRFLTVLNGTATNTFAPEVTFQSPAILINKSKIEFFCIDSADLAEADPNPPSLIRPLTLSNVAI